MPCAHHHQPTSSTELAEAGFHGRLLPGALEHDVDRLVGDPVRLPLRVDLQLVGVADPVGAQRGGQVGPRRRRLDDDDRAEPAGHERGDRQGPDGAGAHHHHRVAAA